MQVIANYLAGKRNFQVGKAIYKVVGKNPHLQTLLSTTAETNFLKNLLTNELSVIQHQAPEHKAYKDEQDKMQESTDIVLNAFREKWMPLHQEMNYLRAKLDTTFSDPNGKEAIAFRRPIARKILETEKEIIAIWQHRNHYQKTGQLPFKKETKTNIPSDPIELAKLIDNTKKYIRLYRLKLTKKPDNTAAANQLAKYKQQYKSITGHDYSEKN